MDKIQITKTTLQPNIRVSKNWKPLKDLIATKNDPKKRLKKNEPKQPKAIGLVCNPVIACFLHSHDSIGHISLISTPNCDLFKALDS